MKHFGIEFKETDDGFYLTRKNYALVDKNSTLSNGHVYGRDFLESHLKNCLYNLDMNLKFFNSLDEKKFNNELDNFLKIHSEFKQVLNLNDFDSCGYYLMILDNYNQAYLGATKNINESVVRHWNIRKPFDRLIFGDKETSMISIDAFRHLDTTRLYAYKTSSIFHLEDEYIEDFDELYLLNRCCGNLEDKRFVNTKKECINL